MGFRLLLASLLLLLFGTAGSSAQLLGWRSRAPQAPRLQLAATVGIVAGDIDSTGIKAASDLSRLLDDGSNLRVIPIVGKGSFQNLSDLLNLKDADVAIVQSDVMARFFKTNGQQGFRAHMQYITKLYSEEFHILARMQFLCLQDLTGRRVSFGPKNSGMAVTAEAVFEANNIAVDPLYLDHEEALARLKRGDLDALVYIGGKPSRAFDRITYKDRVHFLDVDYVTALQANYLPAIITSEDYPNLVASNENVATIGVSSVMVMRSWPPGSERFNATSRFVERFFSEFDKLKTGAFSPKWREVNLSAPLKGWKRFQPAERWLVANAKTETQPAGPQAGQRLDLMLQKPGENRAGPSGNQEELFDQFVRWYQQQGAQH